MRYEAIYKIEDGVSEQYKGKNFIVMGTKTADELAEEYKATLKKEFKSKVTLESLTKVDVVMTEL